MLLVSAKVGPFKSIDKPQSVAIEDGVTVLVGMNEAGKTVFLQALEKSNDVLGQAKFRYIDDYPRKNLSEYEPKHEEAPADVVSLTYRITEKEAAELKAEMHVTVPAKFQFTVVHHYKNDFVVDIDVDDKPAIRAVAATEGISTDFRDAIKRAGTFSEIPAKVEAVSLTEEDKAVLAAVNARIKASDWEDVIGEETWKWLQPRLPKFLYFGDYQILPSEMNLGELEARINDPTRKLEPEHRGILALLNMANVTLKALSKPGEVESLINRIESVSMRLTDRIMSFWKQNENLAVKIDIRNDTAAPAPYTNTPTLRIRIANRRHRDVTTPFRHRSKGFIWFFSFLVWFDSVQNQIAAAKEKAAKSPLILLLDEPGLNLHALAQRDFLQYIDGLAEKHQVVYSTHSPFMIHNERLQEVRVVEDRENEGTVISDNVSWSDERTIFPLQAALGWTIAQNLFISERNLIVEGPADLLFLEVVSAMLGAKGLRSDITICPAGGLDKVVTFVALLGANKLKLAVFHDYKGTPEQKLVDLMRQRMIADKAVMNASQFRDPTKPGASGDPTDLEDLFPPELYLEYFNKAYTKELGGKPIKLTALPAGDRIIDRIERHIAAKGIMLRPSGGFNHYLPAKEFASSPPTLDADTQARFAALFAAVNAAL